MKTKTTRRCFIESSALAGFTLLGHRAVDGLALGSTAAKGKSAKGKAGQKRLSSFDGRVRELLARMTLEEKIGQMTQAEQEALKDPAEIEKYFLGSLLNGGS